MLTQESSGTPGSPSWYESWFNEDYLTVYAHRNEEDAGLQFDLLRRTIPLDPGLRVLDLCCGGGRYLKFFSAAGVAVTGQDLSAVLLGEAAARCPGVPLVHRDMREISGTWDLITSFFTSFGYFDDEGNEAVLRSIASALVPGGHFWLDLPRAEHLWANFTPVTQRVDPSGTLVREERVRDGSHVVKRILLEFADGRKRSYEERVRVYETPEIEEIMASHGFRIQHRFGNYRGDTAQPALPRYILHGAKLAQVSPGNTP